jgi:O-acetyl-ADP-ribose deacetylase (regulator of RNase III)
MKNTVKSLSIPLDLDEYRSLIHLDEPFEAPSAAPESEPERAVIVDGLLAQLHSEDKRTEGTAAPSPYEEKRRLLRALLTVRGPDPLPSWFLIQMDRILQYEAHRRGLTHSASLPRIAEVWPGSSYSAASQTALWRGDITTLEVDAIVNAANAQMLGCFQPFHACIDNVIHCAAGPRVREDCHAIMRAQGGLEGVGRAKVTRAYNLPSKFILHTVGPNLVGRSRLVLPRDRAQLAACYHSCLDLAKGIVGVRSVAFCCISTGVFDFPRKQAAQVALQAVGRWLDSHPGALDLIVFNVFQHEDLVVYERLVRR